uniref:Uncharacterized protein n=1 Tax=Rhizophora mucronata TaxID=61149 RepID=A0A2P2QQR1_RHIMU
MQRTVSSEFKKEKTKKKKGKQGHALIQLVMRRTNEIYEEN